MAPHDISGAPCATSPASEPTELLRSVGVVAFASFTHRLTAIAKMLHNIFRSDVFGEVQRSTKNKD